MAQVPDAVLHNEIRRLRELIERQFAEVTALRSMIPEGDAPMVVDAEPYRAARRLVSPKPNARTRRISDPILWPTSKEPDNTLWPNTGFANYQTDRSRTKVIGFALFGMDERDLDDAVQFVEDNQRRDSDFVPLFLTESPTISVFRKRGYTYEYFPPHRLSRHNAAALRKYAQARLALVRRKWGLAGIVTLGGSELYPVGPVQDVVPAIAKRRDAEAEVSAAKRYQGRRRRT